MMKTKCSPGVLTTVALLAAFLGIFAAPSVLLGQEDAAVHVVVTATTKSSETTDVPQQSVAVRLDGKPQQITGWIPLRGPRSGLELVLLLDDSSRASLGLYLNEIKSFFDGLPPNTNLAVGYMRNGIADLVTGFSTDRTASMNALRLPLGGAGVDASPYFCLTDLIKRWPTPPGSDVRREVIMVTNGVDPYNGRRYDPQDPYVQSAISDAQKAGIIVYSIYFTGAGRYGRSGLAADVGQNYLTQLSGGTGGQLYYLGFGNPVSFTPFLSDIQQKLRNQYELSFVTQPKKDLQSISVKTNHPNTKFEVQSQVLARGAPPATER
jgi:hypothetical protein